MYVAGASSEVDRAERMIRRLRERGVVVTSSWPEVVRLNGENPATAPTASRLRWSCDDLVGVETADMLLALVPPIDQPTRGAWVEIGYAKAIGNELVFAGATKQSIFCAMGFEFETDDAAFDYVLSRAGVTDRGAEPS